MSGPIRLENYYFFPSEVVAFRADRSQDHYDPWKVTLILKNGVTLVESDLSTHRMEEVMKQLKEIRQ